MKKELHGHNRLVYTRNWRELDGVMQVTGDYCGRWGLGALPSESLTPSGTQQRYSSPTELCGLLPPLRLLLACPSQVDLPPVST